jgi:hypothetical protein
MSITTKSIASNSDLAPAPDWGTNPAHPGGVAAERQTRAAKARRESGRRRLVDPTTCDRDYAAHEVEFMNAIQAYKASSGRMFPTWSEVLEVLKGLGYEKA